VGIPVAIKGHLPFAFISLSIYQHPHEAVPSDGLFREIEKSIREQVGAIASFGGMIQGTRMIPNTRSGKILRRVLRES
jgi:propionyl-CoA synthetase